MKGKSRHKEVLNYLINFQLEHDRMPSRKEIMQDLNIIAGPLFRILRNLTNKKILKKKDPRLIRALPYEILQEII